MVKSITGLLVGIAICRRRDQVGRRYGRSLCAGFQGHRIWQDADPRPPAHVLGRRFRRRRRTAGAISIGCGATWSPVAGFRTRAPIDSIVQFNHRIAPPGTRFHYASIEPDVLGVVLRNATGKSLSDYLQEKIWQPIGRKPTPNGCWTPKGLNCRISASTRCCATMPGSARLLAHDGAWDGQTDHSGVNG